MANSIGVVYDSFDYTGASPVTKKYKFDVVSVSVLNIGSAPLTLSTPTGQTVKVPAGYGWDDNIIPTKEITITATGDYHCDVRSR